ncbi:cupin domain-containing protein [Aromatoleum anaerobium]|uniref:Cupin domain-containing protein n=1 Tax=Aromatoleum anaerobium TaxID=182180 RepID=A0ABX1PM82_9RHOO|nr:cupin domain-containing protein [Aromatoleum anaerobium]MCK0505946.1 cupin domain-containing protein [Aromatoleum anaerobium]
MPDHGNLFDLPPPAPGAEIFATLFANAHLRIERIASNAATSPEGFWYDQPDDEWVMLVRGEAMLAFADGRQLVMGAGDWVTIPAHCRHRVVSTGPDAVWLAVHAAGERGNS